MFGFYLVNDHDLEIERLTVGKTEKLPYFLACVFNRLDRRVSLSV